MPPRMNTFSRNVAYQKARLRRLARRVLSQLVSNEAIARGVAIGIFVAIMPIFGMQTLTILLLTTLFRANFLAAYAASCIMNPLTVPPIYLLDYFVGAKLLGIERLQLHVIRSAFEGKSFVEASEYAFMRFGKPLMTGGFVLALACAIPSYFASLPLIRGARKHMKPRRRKRRAITLASASPQRRQLLEEDGFDVTVVAPRVDERASGGPPPRERTLALARAKARDVAARGACGLVVAADTLTVFGDRVIGKPENESHAREILKALSGTTHICMTAVCLVDCETGEERTAVTETEIVMRELTDEMIDDYVASGECMGKAGAYAIQAKADAFVKRIRGSFTNVVGLPMETLGMLLDEHRRDRAKEAKGSS